MERHREADLAALEKLGRLAQTPVDSSLQDLEVLLETPPGRLYPWIPRAGLVLDDDKRIGERLSASFRYSSPVESGYVANDVVSGERWRHVSFPESDAAVVFLHSVFAENFGVEKKLVRAALVGGAHVYAPALPFHMGRQPEASAYSGQYLLSADVVRTVRCHVQAATDAAALVEELRHRGYRRITLAGVSLGGHIACLALTLAKVEGAFLLMPGVDPLTTPWYSVAGASARRLVDERGPGTLERAVQGMSPFHLRAPLAHHDDILFVFGDYDVMCPPERTESLRKAWGGAPAHRFPCGHITMSEHYPEIAKMLAEFVAGT